jgi:hypothetical protein
VPPGKEGKITLAVEHTAGYQGEITKVATVTTNDSKQPTFGLSLKVFFKPDPNSPVVVPQPAPVAQPFKRVGPFNITPSDKWVTAVVTGLTMSNTFTLSVVDQKSAHVTKVNKGGSDFEVTLRTVEDGKQYALAVTSNPALKPGRHTQSIEVSTDDPGMPRIPIDLEVDVYPLVIATPQAIMLPKLALQSDTSRVVIPIIYVRKIRGGGLEVKRATSSLPFLKVEIQTERAGEAYTLRTTIDQSAKPTAGDFQGKITIETNDPDVPVLEVMVHGGFFQQS